MVAFNSITIECMFFYFFPLEDNGRYVELMDFVGAESNFMFDQLGYKKDFLALPVETWNDNNSFKEMNNYVTNLLVINDAGERGVRLITEYIDILTKSDDTRTYLLQVVERNRKIFSDVNISTLNKHL